VNNSHENLEELVHYIKPATSHGCTGINVNGALRIYAMPALYLQNLSTQREDFVPYDAVHLLGIQKRVNESLHLLKAISQDLNDHQCHSTQFEIAYQQEHRKLDEALIVNKTLANQISDLQDEATGPLIHTKTFIDETNNSGTLSYKTISPKATSILETDQ
jgi:hypothetical protein